MIGTVIGLAKDDGAAVTLGLIGSLAGAAWWARRRRGSRVSPSRMSKRELISAILMTSGVSRDRWNAQIAWLSTKTRAQLQDILGVLIQEHQAV